MRVDMCLQMPQTSAHSDVFKTTRWSIVAAAKGGDMEAGRALNELCTAYWHPVYCYVRRQGHDASQTEDLVQDYFASLLRRGYIGEADRTKGRFRAFLLADLKLFLANAARRESTSSCRSSALAQ